MSDYEDNVPSASVADAVAELERFALAVLSKQSITEAQLDSLRTEGNACHAAGDEIGAIRAYTCGAALLARVRPALSDAAAARHMAVLYANRSAAYLALEKLPEAANDGIASVRTDPKYAKGWFRVGTALRGAKLELAARCMAVANAPRAEDDSVWPERVALLAALIPPPPSPFHVTYSAPSVRVEDAKVVLVAPVKRGDMVVQESALVATPQALSLPTRTFVQWMQGKSDAISFGCTTCLTPMSVLSIAPQPVYFRNDLQFCSPGCANRHTDRHPALHVLPGEVLLALQLLKSGSSGLQDRYDCPPDADEVPAIVELACAYIHRVSSEAISPPDLLRAMRQVSINMFAVDEPSSKPDKERRLVEPGTRVKAHRVSGLAVFQHVSKVNHSCLPSADFDFRGRTIIITMLEDGAPGDELTVSYGPHVGKNPCIRFRSTEILEHFKFECVCRACRGFPVACATVRCRCENGENAIQAARRAFHDGLTPTDVLSALSNALTPLERAHVYMYAMMRCSEARLSDKLKGDAAKEMTAWRAQLCRLGAVDHVGYLEQRYMLMTGEERHTEAVHELQKELFGFVVT